MTPAEPLINGPTLTLNLRQSEIGRRPALALLEGKGSNRLGVDTLAIPKRRRSEVCSRDRRLIGCSADCLLP